MSVLKQTCRSRSFIRNCSVKRQQAVQRGKLPLAVTQWRQQNPEFYQALCCGAPEGA
jgi:ABC-type lipoprotein release transport system permease subunit